MQSKAYTEFSSFRSLFNFPYSKDIHFFSQAKHKVHSTTQSLKFRYQRQSLVPARVSVTEPGTGSGIGDRAWYRIALVVPVAVPVTVQNLVPVGS